jgi:outer membrane murein-binding lipoprotein Lpp
MDRKDPEYFQKLEYNTILRKIGDMYYLFIPELSLIVEGKDLNETYRRLEQEKEAYFKKAAELGTQDAIPVPASLAMRKRVLSDLGLFFVKAVIVGSIFVAVFIGSLPLINDIFINQRINQLSNDARTLVTQLSTRGNTKLQNMTPEQKARMKENLKEIVAELKPYFDEVRILWEENP